MKLTDFQSMFGIRFSRRLRGSDIGLRVLAVALDHAPELDSETVLSANYPGGGTVSDAASSVLFMIQTESGNSLALPV